MRYGVKFMILSKMPARRSRIADTAFYSKNREIVAPLYKGRFYGLFSASGLGLLVLGPSGWCCLLRCRRPVWDLLFLRRCY